MKCEKCKHAENCPAKAEYGGAKRCSAYKPQEMTNEEWRRTCSAEEFADWMAQYCCDVNTRDVKEILKNEWLEWLKQPHTIKE